MDTDNQQTAADDAVATLITRVAEGDDDALATLYDSTVGKVFGLAMAICKSTEDAEEVTCDVYTQVWIKAPDFSAERGSGMAWLMTICRSRALDLLRKTAVSYSADVEIDPTDIQHDVQTPESELSRFQENAGVSRALAALTGMQQQAVTLAFFRGCSHGDIAAALGIPLGTAKSHLRRALQSLNNSLDLST